MKLRSWITVAALAGVVWGLASTGSAMDTAIDGEGLAAAAQNKGERKAQQGEAVREALQGAIPAVVKAVAGKPRAAEKPGQVIVPVTLSIDEAAYDKFCRGFEKTLEDLGFKGQERTETVMIDAGQIYLQDGWEVKRDRSQVNFAIIVVKRLNPEAKQARFKVFHATREAVEGFAKGINWTNFAVSILDEEGDEIAAQQYRLETGEPAFKRQDAKPGQFAQVHNVNTKYPVLGGVKLGDDETPAWLGFLTPRLDTTAASLNMWGQVAVGSPNGTRSIREVEFLLSEEDLKRAKTIRCSVQEAP